MELSSNGTRSSLLEKIAKKKSNVLSNRGSRLNTTPWINCLKRRNGRNMGVEVFVKFVINIIIYLGGGGGGGGVNK